MTDKTQEEKYFVRCKHCNGELYALAVSEYNKKNPKVPCHHCGKNYFGKQILKNETKRTKPNRKSRTSRNQD